jgi:hypothetical protein
MSDHVGKARATSLQRMKEIIESAIPKRKVILKMIINYREISLILRRYIEGEMCVNVESPDRKLSTREDAISMGFDGIGDPGDHELFEKYYPTIRNNQGINFKLYTFKGKIWSSGLDFYGFRLANIFRIINKRTNIRLFMDEARDNGAVIINDLCVCRFSYFKDNPFALTFETDKGIFEEMIGKKIATTAVNGQFQEIFIEQTGRNNKKINKLKEIIS